MENQKDQEKQDLRDINEGDRQHIIAFLMTFNLKVKGNQVSILFSENLEKPEFKDLWESESEPEVVKVEFIISNIKS
jgi:hypothetical protein